MNNSHPLNKRSALSETPSAQDCCLSADEHDSVGFTNQEIHRAKIINEKRVGFLTNMYSLADKSKNDFRGFMDLETRKTKIMNRKKINVIQKEKNPNHSRSFSKDKSSSGFIRRVKAGMNEHRADLPSNSSNHKRITGIINLGNTCYMNSVMHCLNCLTPFTYTL